MGAPGMRPAILCLPVRNSLARPACNNEVRETRPAQACGAFQHAFLSGRNPGLESLLFYMPSLRLKDIATAHDCLLFLLQVRQKAVQVNLIVLNLFQNCISDEPPECCPDDHLSAMIPCLWNGCGPERCRCSR